MRIRPGIIIAIVVVFAVLIGGRQLGWFGDKAKTDSGDSQTLTEGSGEAGIATAVAPSATPGNANTIPQPAPANRTVVGNRGAITTPGGTPTAVPTKIEDWEQRVDDLLTAQGDETQKAKQLLEIFPNLPEDGQIEAAQHLSNLLPDEEYASLAPILTNASTPEEVLDVLMTDVLNRPNPLKLGTLLEVARAPNHPKAEEARDVLEVYVDENYGEDWSAWQAAIQKWIKENPEE
jgi:hypothetical protein